jgi:hypothetical protein
MKHSQFFTNVLHFAVHVQCVGENRPVNAGVPLLRQVAQAEIPGAVDGTDVRFQLTREDMKEGGLPGTVRPHHPDPISGMNLKRDFPKEVLLSEKFRYALNIDHRLPSPLLSPDGVTAARLGHPHKRSGIILLETHPKIHAAEHVSLDHFGGKGITALWSGWMKAAPII